MLLLCMQNGEKLYEFKNPTNYAADIAVTDKYIVVNRNKDDTRGELIIYDYCSKSESESLLHVEKTRA